LPALLKGLRLLRDVLELSMAIRMGLSLFGLAVGLQAVVQILLQ